MGNYWIEAQLISIHALLTESDAIHLPRGKPLAAGNISIHALLTESDSEFPIRGDFVEISIHALLTESDVRMTVIDTTLHNFDPRSPHGERRYTN